MVGRLVVALLVVASAAFVMLQKREVESTDIEATISEQRTREATKRAAELEKNLTEAQEQVIALEAKVRWQDEHLTELAADCTPSEAQAPDIEIASLKRRAPAGDLLSARERRRNGRLDERYSLLLRGDAATITRVRLYASLDDGTPLHDKASCDTLADDRAALLVAVVGGAAVVESFGPQKIAKPRGLMPLELLCDVEIDGSQPLSVEVVTVGGGVARDTIAAKYPRPASASALAARRPR